jgi:hypothetical protein
MVEAGRASDLFSELIGGIRGRFVRVEECQARDRSYRS